MFNCKVCLSRLTKKIYKCSSFRRNYICMSNSQTDIAQSHFFNAESDYTVYFMGSKVKNAEIRNGIADICIYIWCFNWSHWVSCLS